LEAVAVVFAVVFVFRAVLRACPFAVLVRRFAVLLVWLVAVCC
jgi:hypothetical protein